METRLWVNVSIDEAEAFIANYPRKLVHNFFMDSHSWHDFTLGELDDSFVVMADVRYGESKLDWRIRQDLYVSQLA